MMIYLKYDIYAKIDKSSEEKKSIYTFFFLFTYNSIISILFRLLIE